jgi:plastocyanin
MLGLILGMLASGATINLGWGNASKPANTVALSIVPDLTGPGNDTFAFSDTLQPAVVIHVSAGQVSFAISNLDTAPNMNYSKEATVPFTFLNETNNGMVAVHYNTGDRVSLTISHTFTIDGIGEVPLVPDTTTSFTLTLKAGTYHFYCIVNCGPGMNIPGYMQGNLVVQ